MYCRTQLSSSPLFLVHARMISLILHDRNEKRREDEMESKYPRLKRVVRCFRGMGQGRRELHLEEMGEGTSVKSRDTDRLQHLLDRSRYRACIHSANFETFSRRAHVPVAAKEQAEEKLELLAGNEGVLQGRVVH